MSPVRVDDRKADIIGHTNGDKTRLAVIAPIIRPLHGHARKDLRGKQEIKAAQRKIRFALTPVPDEFEIV